MACLSDIKISGLRILENEEISLDSAFNLFVGPNGSGKTSILEAAHILGTGRSFRSAQIKHLINRNKKSLFVSANIETGPGRSIRQVNFSSSLGGKLAANINHLPVSALSELAAILPLQLLTTDSMSLIAGEPGNRRRFLDWGVFHMEQEFRSHWTRYRRCLQQRNAWLRLQGLDTVDTWAPVLAESGKEVSEFRESYFLQLLRALQDVLPKSLRELNISMEYHPGWKAQMSLADLFAISLQEDRKAGFTRYGPHRADIVISTPHGLARDQLSRGQQKLLVYALKFAQEALLQDSEEGRKSIFLLDDPASELDNLGFDTILGLLQDLGSQCLIAAVDPSFLMPVRSCRKFHMEQGKSVMEGASYER